MTIETITNNFIERLTPYYHKGEIMAILKIFIQEKTRYKQYPLNCIAQDELLITEETAMNNALNKLCTQTPWQYVLGYCWFGKSIMITDPNVLIPRPETEEMVYTIAKKLPNFSGTILDVGTGSGCIAIELKRLLPKAKISACDISEDALETATTNAILNQSHIHFFKIDVLNESIINHVATIDLIVSNPPYIPFNEDDEVDQVVKQFEPQLALWVPNEDPIIFYKRIIDQGINSKAKYMMFEINPHYASELIAYMSKKNIHKVEIIKDINNYERFCWVEV